MVSIRAAWHAGRASPPRAEEWLNPIRNRLRLRWRMANCLLQDMRLVGALDELARRSCRERRCRVASRVARECSDVETLAAGGFPAAENPGRRGVPATPGCLSPERAMR